MSEETTNSAVEPTGTANAPVSLDDASPAAIYVKRARPPIDLICVFSLVCALLGFCTGITGILAILLGVVGLYRIRTPEIRGRSMAVAGIVLGCVCLVLVAYRGWPLSVAHEAANRASCRNTIDAIGKSMLMYANSNDGQFPDTLGELMVEQGLPLIVFICPSSDDTEAQIGNRTPMKDDLTPGHCSYFYLARGLADKDFTKDLVLICERPGAHHSAGMNVVFADGHVEWLDAADTARLYAQIIDGVRPVCWPPRTATPPAVTPPPRK